SYETWTLREHWSAGTQPIGIRLVRFGPITVRVIDARTGAPIERYGIAHGGERWCGEELDPSFEEPEIAEHPSGETTIFAEPGRHVLRVRAEGYADCQSLVARDIPGSPTQTLRLEREGMLRGSVIPAGLPHHEALVVLERDLVPAQENPPSTVPSQRQDLNAF